MWKTSKFDDSLTYIPTLRFGPDEVFSSMMNFPSGLTSLMVIGPVAVFW